jgi:hypothetical protein
MDISSRKKLWVGLLAISLILSSSMVNGINSRAHAQALETNAGAQEHPANDSQSRPFPILEEASAILGVTEGKLKQSLTEGKSLLDVAKEQGVSEAGLTSKLLVVRSNKIDEAVKSGKITKEKAGLIKAKMQEHISYMIRSKDLQQLQGRGHGKQYNHEVRQMMSPDKLAALIGISEDKLIAQLKTGKSIAEIAQAQGINKQQLISKIKDQLTPYLEKAVEHKTST